jgi:glutamine synthetase
LCDINAVLRGKWLPATSAAKLPTGVARLPLSSYALNIHGEEVEETGLGIVVGDPDGKLLPFAGTLRRVGWARGHVAQVQVYLADEAGMSVFESRAILQRLLERFADQGLTPVVATELEFYLHQPVATAGDAPVPPALTPVAQAYDMDICNRQQQFLSDVLSACKSQDVPVDTVIAEYGPGQFEINFNHVDDAVRAADYAILFRRIVRVLASRHGLAATFMAKPYADAPGNGMHVHASLVDKAGRNILSGQSGVLSPVLKNCIGGLLSGMADMQAIFAPHFNSYRRFQPMSFAPSSANWGFDHRGAGIRVPETSGPGARLEHRISGADVNPYLVLTAILGGMLHGMAVKADPGLPLDDAGASQGAPLSHDWATSLAAFAHSDLAGDIFGAEFVRVYCAMRKSEIASFANTITPAEYRTYLARM